MVSWKGIYFILTLFCGSFFGSIFMLGPFLPLMFVNQSWYRWINNRLVATWLTLPVALLETMFGVKVIITGDAFVPGERSVIIMNHRTRVDWMFLWNCLMRYSYLRLEKICLKASLKSVPGFGWAMQAAAYIFINRKWKDDKSHFEDMIDYFCDIREPLQLLIFPEGTDLTENSKARSNDFAEKNGLQKYEYVIHPRTTGFTFVVDRLREGKRPSQNRKDLLDQPLTDAKATWFTDGSSFLEEGIRKAGAAIVDDSQHLIWAQALPAGTSAQKAEFIALTKALELGEGKESTSIWTAGVPLPQPMCTVLYINNGVC
ncbi:PREDICTED: lysocardiolipin acyltransferase 1-like [Galeopterus variegatus]|uniref:Lysocardiolipin acyltransferase 1-like n=1 Tax=Galeopterus variegatus TaxID=482537 RepID=A0ABM0RSS9_GALVR|nr:PREDICTED: lysocardiolipin acyltransferase 1-like [Galeopterus variegatus]